MQDIELISYLLVFALSVIFSAFALEKREVSPPEASIFSFLSMITWFTLATLHLILAYESAFIVLSYLFMSLGVVFTIYGFATIVLSWQQGKRQKEWELH